jgi:predicted ATPase
MKQMSCLLVTSRVEPRVNDCNCEKLKAIELAIANYNARIRALKKQMKEGTANSWTFRQALARYQRGRDVLDVCLGLERIT